MNNTNKATVNTAPNVLATGSHRGYKYIIKNNSIAYRCGYIEIPRVHPWFRKTYNDLYHVDVHGGLTFDSKVGDVNTLGFDCAHLGDAPDPELPGYSERFAEPGIIRSTEYVRQQCIKLCEEAHNATL